MNVERIRALGPWLAEAKYVWLTGGSTVLALLICLRSGSSEPLIRWTGLVLQVLGIATVVWGIGETRKFFGHAPAFGAVKAWALRFPLRRRDIVVAVSGVSMSAATGQARGHVTHVAGPTPTLQDRVDALERNVTAVHDRITSAQRESDERYNKTKEELAAETAARAAEDDRTRKMLETTATGGVYISAIGSVWLFVGVVLSTAAQELAGWLK